MNKNLKAIEPTAELTLFSKTLGDMCVCYVRDSSTGVVGLSLIPQSLRGAIQDHRTNLSGRVEVDRHPSGDQFPYPWPVESLVQLKWEDQAYPGGFSNGHTLRNAQSTRELIFESQEAIESPEYIEVVTHLQSPGRGKIEHHLKWSEGTNYLELWTEVENISRSPQTLQMLSSFSIGQITPFDSEEASGKLEIHRFRSYWSSEGRLESRSLESLGLERSWAGYGTFVERFGQIGSMPVRQFFPFVAVEDKDSGAVWAASLSWGASWQMELSRADDSLIMSGGLADADFGHWWKTLSPAERFVSPRAFFTVVDGDLTDACQRLVESQEVEPDPLPLQEIEGAILFNEWCQSWGKPSLANIQSTVNFLKGTPVKYYVIDAGWYDTYGFGPGTTHGDWLPHPELFKEGLSAAAKIIREAGLMPGLWFEMETCGADSQMFQKTELLLYRNGVPLTVDGRRFLDMTNSKTIEYLRKRVLGTLLENGFEYLKIDYNNTIGTGADGCESLGEMLRRNIEATYAFVEEIRAAGIVVENCSSGGHRMEHGFVTRTHQFSFSDAHESQEIPIIASAVQQLSPARKSQIWAVLHREDDFERICYSIAATFMGRMCLSGSVERLAPENWALVKIAMALYGKCWPTIREGTSRSYGPEFQSWRRPTGWQANRRIRADGKQGVIVIHSFRDAREALPVRVPLPSGGEWKLSSQFPDYYAASISDGELQVEALPDFTGAVFLVEKD